jgi:hypothetical protein
MMCLGDKNTQVRGGVGLFAVATPGVWIGNQYATPVLITDALMLQAMCLHLNLIH